MCHAPSYSVVLVGHCCVVVYRFWYIGTAQVRVSVLTLCHSHFHSANQYHSQRLCSLAGRERELVQAQSSSKNRNVNTYRTTCLPGVCY